MGQSSQRILVLGGTGMLGSVLWGHLRATPGWQVRRTQRRSPEQPDHFDVTAPGEPLDALLAASGGADLVINAIGLTQAQIAAQGATGAEHAELVNGLFPRRLAAAAGRAGAEVIHVSTDGVFSGRTGPYDESATPDPQDLYGRSKLLGEVAAPHVLTLRCSLIGPDPEGGRGLFEWFRGLKPGARVQGYTDQRWNGVTSDQLAEVCRTIVEGNLLRTLTAIAPVRHFCPNQPVTKYELLDLFRAELGAPVVVEAAASGKPIDRTLTSRWQDLNRLAGAPVPMADAVQRMIARDRQEPR